MEYEDAIDTEGEDEEDMVDMQESDDDFDGMDSFSEMEAL